MRCLNLFLVACVIPLCSVIAEFEGAAMPEPTEGPSDLTSIITATPIDPAPKSDSEIVERLSNMLRAVVGDNARKLGASGMPMFRQARETTDAVFLAYITPSYDNMWFGFDLTNSRCPINKLPVWSKWHNFEMSFEETKDFGVTCAAEEVYSYPRNHDTVAIPGEVASFHNGLYRSSINYLISASINEKPTTIKLQNKSLYCYVFYFRVEDNSVVRRHLKDDKAVTSPVQKVDHEPIVYDGWCGVWAEKKPSGYSLYIDTMTSPGGLTNVICKEDSDAGHFKWTKGVHQKDLVMTVAAEVHGSNVNDVLAYVVERQAN